MTEATQKCWNHESNTNRFLEAMKVGAYDFTEICDHDDFMFTLRDPSQKCDINLVIGCSGRPTLVRATVKYLKKTIAQSSLSVRLVISEMGDFPLMEKLAKEESLSYIFTPFEVSDTEYKHSEGLAHNISYLLAPKTSWYCFHCSDTIVPENWLQRIEPYLTDETTFLQPFSQKRLKYCNESYTRELCADPEGMQIEGVGNALASNILPNREKLFLPEAPAGAPGGSIFIRREDFERVGGYDPEIFWGWAPEDTMMWIKQEYLHNGENFNIDNINYWAPGYCHLGRATYASEDVLLFHLHHPPSPRSKHMLSMKEVCDSSFPLAYSYKLEYFSAKQKLLKEDRAKLQHVRQA